MSEGTTKSDTGSEEASKRGRYRGEQGDVRAAAGDCGCIMDGEAKESEQEATAVVWAEMGSDGV